MTNYIIGLGSSLPNGKYYIKKTFTLFKNSHYIKIYAKSKIYKNIGINCKKYMIFYNSAASISTNLVANSLWFKLYAIEKKLGRLRPYKNSPRTIDLDILWTNNKHIKTKNIEIPHPNFFNRNFSLKIAIECTNKCIWKVKYNCFKYKSII